MNHIIQEHFKKILSQKTDEMVSDFSRDLVSIVHIDGKSKTLAYYPTLRLLQRVTEEIFFSEPESKVLVNRCTPDYGVLSIHSKSFAPFVNYTCIAKEGKISYVTLYIFSPKHKLLSIEDTEMEKGKEVKKVFHKHFLAMFTMNPDVITKDYEDSAVVITNMTKNICNGKGEIYAFCHNLMKSSGRIMKHIRIGGFPVVKWKTKSLPDGILLLVCELKALRMVMTETYYVKNGKIQFESSICGGRLLKTIRENLNEQNVPQRRNFKCQELQRN